MLSPFQSSRLDHYKQVARRQSAAATLFADHLRRRDGVLVGMSKAVPIMTTLLAANNANSGNAYIPELSTWLIAGASAITSGLAFLTQRLNLSARAQSLVETGNAYSMVVTDIERLQGLSWVGNEAVVGICERIVAIERDQELVPARFSEEANKMLLSNAENEDRLARLRAHHIERMRKKATPRRYFPGKNLDPDMNGLREELHTMYAERSDSSKRWAIKEASSDSSSGGGNQTPPVLDKAELKDIVYI